MNDTQLQKRDEAIAEISARLGVRAERGRRFAELTSLRVGGSIDWVISPQTEAEAAAVVHELEQAGIGWRALGSGSNVLADDGEHHYVVLALKELKGEVRFEGDLVHVSAGYSLPRLCVDVARQGLSGIEGLGGIPGTVGGALWMNAGAYGHEIGTVTETVRVAFQGRRAAVGSHTAAYSRRCRSDHGADGRGEKPPACDSTTRRAFSRLFLQKSPSQLYRDRQDDRRDGYERSAARDSACFSGAREFHCDRR